MSLIKIVNSRINSFKKEEDEGIAKIHENFVYYLSWVAEDTWKAQFKRKFLQEFLEDLNKTDKEGYYTVITKVLSMIMRCLDSPYNVREKSTNPIHNEVSTWKFQCYFDLRKIMEEYLNLLNEN